MAEDSGTALTPAARLAAAAVLGLVGIAGVGRAWLWPIQPPLDPVRRQTGAEVPPPPSTSSASSAPAAAPAIDPPDPRDAGVERRVNVNTAGAAELDLLPGIGPALAARIIADREANGPFRSLDDLDRVSGIGTKTIAKLAPFAKAE